MTIPMGPHQRRGRRRRRGKALVLCVVLVMMAIFSNMTVWDKPEPEREQLEPSALGWMINRSAYSPGDGRAFADQYPELEDLFLNAEPLPVP